MISDYWALIPVKGDAAAKSRLSPELCPQQRNAIRTAMLTDVLEGLQRSERLAGVAICGPQPAFPAATGRLERLMLRQAAHVDGLNPAVEDGVRTLAAAGARVIAVVPADIPLLDGRELDRALVEADAGQGTVVIPDRHGEGTNGIVFPARLAPRFRFGPGSYRLHLEGDGAGTRPRAMPLASFATDIDLPADLAAFARAAPSSAGRHTRAFLRARPAHESELAISREIPS